MPHPNTIQMLVSCVTFWYFDEGPNKLALNDRLTMLLIAPKASVEGLLFKCKCFFHCLARIRYLDSEFCLCSSFGKSTHFWGLLCLWKC